MVSEIYSEFSPKINSERTDVRRFSFKHLFWLNQATRAFLIHKYIIYIFYNIL